MSTRKIPRPIFEPFPTPNMLITLMAKDAMMTSRALPDGTNRVSTKEVMTSPSSSRE